ncbi:MAG: hypothetical protein M3P53_08855 [Actinomycetota bacterium]|nr:hypothetical protein [Actinomycetota bacterium]
MATGWRHTLGALVLTSALGSSSCGGSGSPAATTTTTSPATLAAGREVCQGFFADLQIVPRVERAKEAGPRLGQIFEQLAELRAQQAAGEVSGQVLVERVRTVVTALEIVCQDDFGVPPPPGYLKRSSPAP